jgi:hypothetical protein
MLDSIKRINDCRIRQPGFEVRDLPVLNHCFIRNAFWETDYPGQQWVMGYRKIGGRRPGLSFPITHLL